MSVFVGELNENKITNKASVGAILYSWLLRRDLYTKDNDLLVVHGASV